MKKIKTTFFSDSGHAWLAVKRQLLEELEILDQISAFSYQKGNTVYLEEESDVNLLFNNLKMKYNINKLDEFFEIKTSFKEYSPIRLYSRFNKNKVIKFENNKTVYLYGNKYKLIDYKNRKVQDENQNVYKLTIKQMDELYEA